LNILRLEHPAVMASDLEAVCRSEAQRVVFALRGNRRFGSRSWRDLEETSPLRQLCAWRLKGGPYELLLEPLLRVIRSPDFAGPATFVALEAAQNVVVAICEEQRSQTTDALRFVAQPVTVSLRRPMHRQTRQLLPR